MAHAINFRLRRRGEVKRDKLAILPARLNSREAIRHRVRFKRGIPHAKRVKDFLLTELINASAIHGFNRLTQPVYAWPIAPAFAGVEHQRVAERSLGAAQNAGMPGRFQIAPTIGAPEFIFQPAAMGRQMTNGGRGFRRAHYGRVPIPAVQHLKLVPIRKDVSHCCVHRHLAPVDHDHRRKRSHRLGGRENPKHRIFRRRAPLGGLTGCA